MKTTPNHQITEATQEIAKLIENLSAAKVTRLPTESELVDRLSYGRYTIRKAVQHFVEQGTLEKIQGRGTFIVGKKNAISFSGWIGTEPPGDKAIASLIERFHAKQSDIVISYRPIPYYQTIEKTLNLALEGNPPDVMQLTPPIFAALKDIGLLRPLDDAVNQNHLKRRFPIDVESGRIGRQLYAVTWGLAPLVLYYNRNVLKDAGIDPDSPPRTLDELSVMCARIKSTSNGEKWGTSLPLSVNDPNFLWLYPYFLSFGGGFTDARSGNLVIDSKANADALVWLSRLYREGAAPGIKDVTEGRMLFATDRIGFWIDGPWLRGLFRQLSPEKDGFDSHYGVALIPAGPTGRSESILWNHSLGISSQCRDVERAYRWVEYLTTTEECARRYFDVLGMLPPSRDILHTDYFFRDDFARVCIDQMETVSTFPIYHPLFSKSLPFVSQVISEIVASSMEPLERLSFLNEIVQMINQNRFLSIFTH